MDTVISNGDFLLDARGIPVAVTGVQELLQRALIRLTVKKGSFIYDANLGSELHKLKAGSKNIKGEALNMIREALAPIPEITAEDVSVRYINSGENLDLNVILSVGNKTEEVEVIL